MTTYQTGNPIGSADPRDLYDNAQVIDDYANSGDATTTDRLGASRRTLAGMESEFEADQSARSDEYAAGKAARDSEFEADQERREATFQQLLVEQGYQELGEYEAGIEITQYNQVVTVGNYLYRLSPSVALPYTTSGDWQADSGDFVQIDFVTASQLAQERLERQSADSSLQDQITEAAPIAAAERPLIQWHGQVIENSITIPDNVNAFTFGPSIEIADGQSVTVGDNSHWTIAEGVAGNA
jgi:hypothetical protein